MYLLYIIYFEFLLTCDTISYMYLNLYVCISYTLYIFELLLTCDTISYMCSILHTYYKNIKNNTFIYFFSLGFSVTIFCIEAFLAIMILMLRRNPAVGGELGGPKSIKTASAAIFVFFWVFYVFISTLEAADS